MRTLYDSVNASAIPTTVAMVAGYLPPSRFAWSDADWARFPRAVKVQIAVRATTNAGIVLDVEQGDATPQQAPSWVLMRRAAGVDPTVYCSEAAWSAVRQAFTAANVAQPHYWVAAYPGAGPSIPDGAIAHQYVDPPNSGGDWDLSVVADHWPGVDKEEPVTTSFTQAEHDKLVALADQYLPGNQPSTIPAHPAGGMATILFDLAGEIADTDTTAAIASLTANVAAAFVGLHATLADLQAAIAALQPTTALSGTANVTIQLGPVAEADTIQGDQS